MSIEEKKPGIKSTTRVVNVGAPEPEEEKPTKAEQKALDKAKAEKEALDKAKAETAKMPSDYKPKFPTLDSKVNTKEYLEKIQTQQKINGTKVAQMTFEQKNQILQNKKVICLKHIKDITDKYGEDPDARYVPHQARQWKALHEELARIEGEINKLEQQYANIILFGQPSPSLSK